MTDQLSRDLEAALAGCKGNATHDRRLQVAAILPVVLAANEQATTTERERWIGIIDNAEREGRLSPLLASDFRVLAALLNNEEPVERK